MKAMLLRFFKPQRNKSEFLESMSSPAEFTWTWDRYKKLFLEEKRISNGKKFIKENSTLFKQVEDEFGVPKEIITSILGVETRYGKIKVAIGFSIAWQLLVLIFQEDQNSLKVSLFSSLFLQEKII